MNPFINNPFIRILGFWIAGLISCKFLPSAIYFAFILSFALCIYSIILFKNKNYPYDLVNSIFLGSLIFILAFYFTLENTQKVVLENYKGYFSATILEPPLEKNRSFQLNIKIDHSDSLQLYNTKAIIYSEKTPKISQLKTGDKILCKGQLTQIKNNGNPFEFDYAIYMANQGYYYSTYLKAESIRLTGKSTQTPKILAEKLRTFLLGKLKTQIGSTESFQVISALTLGYRKELSKEVKSHFASTGAMHVLAVSGLHVGMIFLFLSQVFFFLKRNKKSRFLYVLIIGSILWFYALLTGFSPSVQRATVMFSFILIGNSLKRPVSIYNSLAASAFLLLLFNPKLIFEVGFQLSYMAVTAIVFFYPKLEKIISPKYWLLKKLWQLTCVSIAAQIGTFAISIFYFQQFPLYFWLSNFAVIPAAYLILGLTFTLFIFSWLQPVALILATILTAITEGTIYLLKLIEQLPFSLIENISISTLQLFCLLGFTLLTMFFIKWKRKSYLFGALTLFVIFQSNGLYTKSVIFNQQKIIIYQADSWLIHLINGRENYLLYEKNKVPSAYAYRNVINQLKLNEPICVETDYSDQLVMPGFLINNKFIQFTDIGIHILSHNNLILINKEQAHPQAVFLRNNSSCSDDPIVHVINNKGAFITDLQ